MGKRLKRQHQKRNFSTTPGGFNKRKQRKLNHQPKNTNHRRCSSSSSSNSSHEDDASKGSIGVLPSGGEEMRTSTNSNTEQKAVEAAPVEQTKPSPQGEDVQFLPNVDTLLENPVKQWYKEYNFIDPTYNDQDPTEQDKIKLQRKSIGIRVSVRPTTIDSGTKKSLEEDNVVFSLDKCPPPLPTNFFQILKERMKHTNIIDDIDPTSTVAKHDNHKEISSAVQHVSQLLYQVHIQSKGKIDQPTPVQLQTWPILLSGKCKNVLVVAPTGSGKTLCYGVGIVQFCLNAILKETNNRVSSSINFRVEDGPMALIVSPTRELANQICHNLKQVANCANAILRHNHCHQPSSAKARRTAPKVRIIPIYGGDGMSRNEQLAYFDPGEPMIHIVAATPGRLLDLLGIGDQTKDRPNASSAKNLSLKNVSWFVIDEADKMLQLGFREQIDIISSKIRKDRMTVQLSATFPERLSKACNSWLGTGTSSDENNNLIVVKSSTIQIGINERNRPKATSGASSDLLSTDEKLAKPPEELANNETREFGEENRVTEISMIPSHIAQILHVCSTHKKPKKLLGILCKLREAERESGRTRHQGLLVVFFLKIKTLQFISKLLKKEAVAKCTELHGQLKQWEREGALNDFKSGKVSVLLSTDVAARGIHVNNIRYIINYDFPTSIEQYVHRCGRAARSYKAEPNETTLAATKQPAACVYSFFTRELAPMAKDILQLLKATNAWIDPNLVSLANESGNKDPANKGKPEKKCTIGMNESIVEVKSPGSTSENN